MKSFARIIVAGLASGCLLRAADAQHPPIPGPQASLPMSGSMLKQASGMVVPTPNLATGTLRVRVRTWTGEDGDSPAVAGATLELRGFPEAGPPTLITQTTDQDGAATLRDLPDAMSLRVELVHQGIRYRSQPFTRVPDNGLMLVMLVYPARTEMGDSHVEQMLLMADGTMDGVRVLTAFSLMCSGEQAVDFGAAGLSIPLPAAARDVQVALDASFKIPEPDASVVGQSIVLQGGLVPEVPRSVIIGYRLEPAAAVELRWTLPLATKEVEIQIPRLVDLRLDHSNLGSADALPAGQIVRAKDLPAGKAVELTLKNVPAAAELFTDDASVLSLVIDYQIGSFTEDAVGIWQVCTIGNRSRQIYRNSEGIYLSVAKNFVGVPEVDGSDSDVALVPMRGVRVGGPIEPSGRRAQFGYFLAIKDGAVMHAQMTDLRVDSFTVQAVKKGDLAIKGLGDTQAHAHAQAENQTVLVAHSQAPIAAGEMFSFALEGLPRKSRLGRTAVTIAAAVALLCVLVMGEHARRERRRTDPRGALEARREQLMDELLTLESRRAQDQVAPSDYATRRESLLSKLESVTVAITTTGAR